MFNFYIFIYIANFRYMLIFIDINKVIKFDKRHFADFRRFS